MHPLQAMVDGMNAQWQRERAESQMTLGEIIKQLETMQENLEIKGLGKLDSYRGYYSDLAFEPIEQKRTVGEILTECRNAMGKVFIGYKGGEYVMGEKTPLWVATYGCCGRKLMALTDEGVFETEEDD